MAEVVGTAVCRREERRATSFSWVDHSKQTAESMPILQNAPGDKVQEACALLSLFIILRYAKSIVLLYSSRLSIFLGVSAGGGESFAEFLGREG